MYNFSIRKLQIPFTLLVFIMIIFILSCNNKNNEKKKTLRPDKLKKSLIEANKKLVANESEDIKDFLRRYKWNVEETGSGLMYYIYKEGSGEKAEKGKLAVLNYKVFFLTGDLIESSEESGQLIFRIGKEKIIAGLQEGILYLREGDKAKFIIPSHLAYGLVGKPGKIPPKTTLVYDIEVIDIK